MIERLGALVRYESINGLTDDEKYKMSIEMLDCNDLQSQDEIDECKLNIANRYNKISDIVVTENETIELNGKHYTISELYSEIKKYNDDTPEKISYKASVMSTEIFIDKKNAIWGDEDSQDRMARAIIAYDESDKINWETTTGSIVRLSIGELKIALRKSMDKQQELRNKYNIQMKKKIVVG